MATAGLVLSIIGCVGMAAVGVSQVWKGVTGTIEDIKKAKMDSTEEQVEDKKA